jgi:hypothetical protein
MEQVLLAAAHHKGTAFVEIYQNCVIFNDACFEDFAEKGVRDDKTIDLQPGQPMVFGKELDKGIKIVGWEPQIVPAAEADVWKSDTHSAGPAFVMSQLHLDPTMPRPIGHRARRAGADLRGRRARADPRRDPEARRGHARAADLQRRDLDVDVTRWSTSRRAAFPARRARPRSRAAEAEARSRTSASGRSTSRACAARSCSTTSAPRWPG